IYSWTATVSLPNDNKNTNPYCRRNIATRRELRQNKIEISVYRPFSSLCGRTCATRDSLLLFYHSFSSLQLCMQHLSCFDQAYLDLLQACICILQINSAIMVGVKRLKHVPAGGLELAHAKA